MKIAFYYSGKTEPGSQYPCDNAEAKRLIAELKASGVNADAVDTDRNPPGFMKYNAAVTGPAAKHRAVFGTKGALEEEFGGAVPALLVYTKDDDRYPDEVFPRNDRDEGRLLGIVEALRTVLRGQAELSQT